MSLSCTSRKTPSAAASRRTDPAESTAAGATAGCCRTGRAVDRGVDGGSGPATDPRDPDGGSASTRRRARRRLRADRSEIGTEPGRRSAVGRHRPELVRGSRTAGAGAAWTGSGGAGGGVNGGVEVTDPVERVGGVVHPWWVSGEAAIPPPEQDGIGATCCVASGDTAGRGGAGGGPAGGGVAGRGVPGSGIPEAAWTPEVMSQKAGLPDVTRHRWRP